MIEFDEKVKKSLSPEDITTLNEKASELRELLRQHGRTAFEPFADYDQDLDCIRVIVKDCSVCEYRINEYLTVLHDTDPESPPGPIGFTLKGIRAQLDAKRDSLSLTLGLTELLDELIKRAPNEEALLQVISQLKKLTHRAKLEKVEVRQAA